MTVDKFLKSKTNKQTKTLNFLEIQRKMLESAILPAREERSLHRFTLCAKHCSKASTSTRTLGFPVKPPNKGFPDFCSKKKGIGQEAKGFLACNR